MSILGIILPLLVTVYASNSEGLDPGLFTIFFGTLLMVFLEYFGVYICLYLIPKYGISWNIKELDEKKLRIFSEEGSEEDREESWDYLLVEQGATYIHSVLFIIGCTGCNSVPHYWCSCGIPAGINRTHNIWHVSCDSDAGFFLCI